MKSLLFLFSVFALNSFNCLYIEFDYKCDFRFGNPSWNYSKVFYEREFYMEPGRQDLQVHIPKEGGQLISFVCVNLDGTPKENAIVDYISLFHLLTVKLIRPVDQEVSVHILAKEHGY